MRNCMMAILFLYIVFISLVAGRVIEPKCSKFDYDEQLLEKMVRQEHSYGIMKEEFQTLKAQVTSSLEDMAEENRKFRIATQEEREQAKERLNAEQNAFKSELENLTATVHEEQTKATELVKAEIQQATRHLSAYAFSAYWVSPYSLNTGNVLVFSKTLLDTDGAYNNKTGKYTAAVTGIYFFTSQLCSNDGRYSVIKMFADETRIGLIVINNNDHHCSSESVTAKIQKGSKVWLQLTGSRTDLYNHNSDGFCNFAGHLITEIV